MYKLINRLTINFAIWLDGEVNERMSSKEFCKALVS